MPALLTSTSSFPKCRVVAATTAAQSSSLVTSSGSNRAAAPMASATWRPSCSSTSPITTLAPSRANMRAVAAPIPDAAPEMMAILPASLIGVLLCFVWRSAAGEIRPPLLRECPHRFLVILGKIRLRLETEAQIHHRMGKLTQRDVDGLLGPADRPHRAAGEAAGQPINLLIELIGRHDVVDQPDTLGLRRAHQVAGEQVLLGACKADELPRDQ